MAPWLTIVGIGEDGLAGLGGAARGAIAAARTLIGGRRHLALVPEGGQERIPWPSPLSAAFALLEARRGEPLCILASGDPMWFGIGATLARRFPPAEMRVLPAPSSLALAAARLAWPLQEVEALSVHGRPLAALHPYLYPGARLLILAESGATAGEIAALLRARGFGASAITVLEHLGGPKERRRDGIARDWPAAPSADLSVIAVHCAVEAGAQAFPRLAGLPDEAYRHDGQLTKRAVRAVALAHLGPLPGELLWDVGAGCGSIGIEWMRSHARCRAIAIEAEAARAALIAENATRLGVPDLRVIEGRAPEALARLEAPSAVFIGGGVTLPGVLERAWEALAPGGRLVANAVTLESEALLATWQKRLSGELIRIALSEAGPLGRFTAWRAALPVTMLAATKR